MIRSEDLHEDQVQRFLHGLCLQDLGSKECSCELFRASGECGHLLAFVHHIDKNFVQGKLKPKKNPNTSGKRGCGRPRGWQNPDSDSSDCDAWLLWFSFLLFVKLFKFSKIQCAHGHPDLRCCWLPDLAMFLFCRRKCPSEEVKEERVQLHQDAPQPSPSLWNSGRRSPSDSLRRLTHAEGNLAEERQFFLETGPVQ